MNSKNRSHWMKKLTAAVVATGISLPVSLPVLAQSYYSASIFIPSSTSTSRSVDGTIAGELDAALKYYLEFQTFAEAVKETGLAESLRAKDSNDPNKALFTVFVPTDEAFEALPEDIRKKLFEPENRDKLMMVLNYHLVEGTVSDEDVAAGAIATMAGSEVKIELNATGDKIAINENSTVLSSQRAKNGVMVSIDRVLLPPNLELN
ncbi:MAG: fasciclin domain-containing protein [Okeania sp. SIO2H7]|nr:fasciclin domain-containing protein [Okeania sp. SIO2H7]